MSRLTYAARTLIEQVKAGAPDTVVELGEPDGLDVIREVTFDPSVGKWLSPQLNAHWDSRVVSAENDRKRGLHLTFSPGIIADQAHPFNITVPANKAEVKKEEHPEDETGDQ